MAQLTTGMKKAYENFGGEEVFVGVEKLSIEEGNVVILFYQVDNCGIPICPADEIYEAMNRVAPYIKEKGGDVIVLPNVFQVLVSQDAQKAINGLEKLREVLIANNRKEICKRNETVEAEKFLRQEIMKEDE